MSWTVPDYSDIVHLQKYQSRTPPSRFSDPGIYVSAQRTKNLQNKVYPSPAPSPTLPSNTSPRFPDYPCKPYPRRYSWKVMLEIYPDVNFLIAKIYFSNITKFLPSTKEKRVTVTAPLF